MGGAYFQESATPPLQGWVGPQRSPIFRFPSIYADTLWFRMTKFDVVTYLGRGLFLGGQPHPVPKVQNLCAAQFLGFSFISTPFNAKRSHFIIIKSYYGAPQPVLRSASFGKVTWGEGEGRGVFLGVSQALRPRGMTPESPNFGVHPYLCIHGLT